jgi:hypothetical protein
MTLESCAASSASENERGQHGQRCENPLHVSLPSPGSRVSRRASTVCSSGGLVGHLRGYRGPIPLRHAKEGP